MSGCLWVGVKEQFIMGRVFLVAVYGLVLENCHRWAVIYEQVSVGWYLWVGIYGQVSMGCY